MTTISAPRRSVVSAPADGHRKPGGEGALGLEAVWARSSLDPASDRSVVRWLIASALAVVAAIAVGGITRLTESGLSITEWKPISGLLPPLSAAEWSDAYTRYLAIPEAQTTHRGITLESFKQLFWWEWGHRLLARCVGLVLTLPYFVLLWRGRLRPVLRLRLANLPLLAALQGVMGWYMVQSGLVGRTSVSPYRLVAHLSLALLVFAIAVWTAAALARDVEQRLAAPSGRKSSASVRATVAGLVALTLLTILSGGFVAGLDAGRIYNTFPLMEGQLVPSGYWAIEAWRNAFENPVAVQLHHRLLAVMTTLLVWTAWFRSERRRWPDQLRRWMRLAALAALVQASLGIATLLLAVPVSLAAMHQMGAVALFTALLLAAASAFDASVRLAEDLPSRTPVSLTT